jgi:hypothetical protein
MLRVFAGAALAAAVLSGCASTPKPVITGQTAQLEFSKGYIGTARGSAYGRSSVQFYSYYDDPACKEVKPMALNWTTSDTRSQASASGRRIALVSSITTFQTESVYWNGTAAVANMSTSGCENAAGFTPLAGRTYTVTQRIIPSGCRLEVIDKSTGAPPPDLEDLPPATACKGYLSGAGG